MVTIATFDDTAKAKQLKDRLQQAGVKADVHNEGHLQSVAFMSKPHAHAKVMVDEKEFEAAQKLMMDWEESEPTLGAAAIRCPQCKSPRIEYPQLTRRFLTPGLAAIMFALKIFPKEFYCQDCHFTWGKDGEPLPRPAAWETFS